MYDYHRMSTNRLVRFINEKKRRCERLLAKVYCTKQEKDELDRLQEQIKIMQAVVWGRLGTLPLWLDE